MQSFLTVATLPTLQAYLATLDFQINQLSQLFSSIYFKTGSLMLSGKNCISKEFKELIIWDSKNPMPKNRVKEFLQNMAQDLIYRRLQVIHFISEVKSEVKSETQDKTAVAACPGCAKDTLQRNYLVIPGSVDVIIPIESGAWICNECETIIKP